MTDDPAYPCPECQLGILAPRRVSYFTVQGGNVVSVPDFPAWVCDVCGRCEYDSAALAELNVMLSSGRLPRRARRRRGGPEAPRPGVRPQARRRP